MKSIKRVAAVLATTAVAVTTFGVLSAPAHAMKPGDGWYRCWIPDYGYMWCYDV
ncbi:hypothetical protein [Microbispora bryophytorum]|uniref:Uncharacterized protein n=2 Tax=Microbispora bryophytorum TaxID=1460882 RepID=A0A8H9GV87_9ACTN|nr:MULTISPECIES: hypothetical protein [Microbispora]MBD3139690.1 hypothetical protein [Microbispora bryophytorum]MBD3147710.1 hypothetical protein [Microbispora camponoti]GGO03331.1 hypothetical protein GCM10011574_13080 [Microbispora bryophytorum]